MKIQKIGHSCVLIEEAGKRLLIDPGAWAFAPIGKGEPEEMGAVDVILFTHEHQDHFAPDILKRILLRSSPRIITHTRIKELLSHEGIEAENIEAEEEVVVAGFRIRGVEGAHGTLPVPTPPNLGYLINETFFHPGDSFAYKNVAARVFAMPLAAPWMRLTDIIDATVKLKPKHVVYIHDGYVKEFFRTRLEQMAIKVLGEHGIEGIILQSGEKREV